MWEELLRTLGSTTVIVGATAYVIRQLFGQVLDRDMAAFRVQLEQASQSELEHLRKGLEAEAHERRVRFNTLHERRASAIAEVYGSLWEGRMIVADFGSLLELPMDAEGAQHVIELNASARALMARISKQLIYFPVEIATKILSLANRLVQSSTLATRVIMATRQQQPEEEARLRKEFRNMTAEMLEVQSDLENDLREALGVASDNGD